MRHIYIRGILSLIWFVAAIVSMVSGNFKTAILYVMLSGVFLFFAYTTWKNKGEE